MVTYSANPDPQAAPRPAPGRAVRWLRSLLAWGLSLVVAAGTGELLCRLAGMGAVVYPRGMYVPEENPQLAYGLARSHSCTAYGRPVRVNALGYRGGECAPVPATGVFRVFCAGDSFTFGMGVRDGETWPAVLQTLLSPPRGYTAVEVVNGGVCGYNLRQYCQSIREAEARVHPHLILVGVVGNDLGPAFSVEDGYLKVPARALKWSVPGKRWFQTHSQFYQFLSLSYTGYLYSKLKISDPQAARALMFQDTDSIAAAETETVVAEFLRRRAPEQAPVMGFGLFLPPDSPVPRVCQNAGLTLLPCALAAEHRLPDSHPSPEGHRGYARQIAAAVARLDSRHN